MNPRTKADISEPISGDRLYQKRAREALPILVRQAKSESSIYYSDLANELGMPNPRNLNYVLASIGRVMENLSAAWKIKVPAIQCLVVNKKTELPGEGIGGFLIKKEDFSKLSQVRRQEIVQATLSKIFTFPKWNEVLNFLNLQSVEFNSSSLNDKAAHFRGGESEAHLKLKRYVANNPLIVGLPTDFPCGKTEFSLPSGDAIDVSFCGGGYWIAAEVKSSISPEQDIVRGLYQCIKYQAVMRAVQASEQRERSARALLVIEGVFPRKLVPLKNMLRVQVVDKIKR
ncbi:MAG: hypothetical protein J0H41_00820 [Rhizobiales bacterium]|nr:hypothetical protein [Hyphomicrobiales bacterium]